VAIEDLLWGQGSDPRRFEGRKKINPLGRKEKSPWWQWRDSLSQKGERQACRFLQKQGYKILSRRFATRFGEIDIVARHSQTLAFVEVKTRQGLTSSDPLEAITYRKWQSLQRASVIYLQKHRIDLQNIQLEFLGIGIRTEGAQIKLDCVPLFFD
jgi:putative endonuclease